ncbi:MAG: PEGA domain-containing protein [Planctomycetota bacterium]
MSRLVCLCICVALASSGLACVRRTLTIKSDPPGAQVFIDDYLAGETPLDYEFTYYGTRKIVIEKRDADGKLEYERETVYARVGAPYYERFPLDFVSEVLVPVDIHDNHQLRFQLRKKKFQSMDEVKEDLVRNAEELRAKSYSTEIR